MKHFFKFSVVALAAMTAGLLNSCTENEALTPDGTAPVINLLKAPDVIAYSGSNVWGSTLSTRGANTNANEWDKTWDCPPRPAEDLTPEELAELKDLLSKGVETHNEIIIPFENYYVQQIYKGEDRYNTHDRCYDGGCNHVNTQTELGSGHMDKLVAWNPSEVFDYRPEDNWQGAWYTTEYEHVNNFNNGTNTNKPGDCGCGVSHFGTTLMTDMPTEGVNPEKQFGFHETWGTAHDYNNYIIVEYKGYYYVGFDYEAHKYDQNTHNHGEGLDIERDWNFTDWIVRITPAYPKGTTPEDNLGGVTNPGDDNGGNTGDNNGDDNGGNTGDNNGDDNGGNTGDNNGDNNGDNTDDNTGNVDHHTNEVEVNLHASEDHAEGPDSHLSLHVRAATDVTIFIPILEKYYCQKDDMDILGHYYYEGNYGGNNGTSESKSCSIDYQVGGKTVTFTVVYGYQEEYEKNGILITTEGIDEDVITYCRENFNDGITFEVWNYFNDNIDLETLKGYLNQATISFSHRKNVDYYINAFGEVVGNGEVEPNDCTVSIVENEKQYFDGGTTGEHLNGSHFNKIYENNKSE